MGFLENYILSSIIQYPIIRLGQPFRNLGSGLGAGEASDFRAFPCEKKTRFLDLTLQRVLRAEGNPLCRLRFRVLSRRGQCDGQRQEAGRYQGPMPNKA